jgi:hypothetical protein
MQEPNVAFPVLKISIKERDNLIRVSQYPGDASAFVIERLPVYYGQFVHRLHLASRVSG